jgi:hypothetical protein
MIGTAFAPTPPSGLPAFARASARSGRSSLLKQPASGGGRRGLAEALRAKAAAMALAAAAAFVLSGQAIVSGQQMPDPKEIAGIPLPVGDLGNGTVVVRVIKGSLANNIAGQPVELLGAGPGRTVTTDATGRAQFSGLSPGARVKAVTTVAGERLESQEFPVPATGGVRVLLVATDPDAVKRADEDRQLAAGPAQPGSVVLGEQSRIVIEVGDRSLSVFNILQILNTARTPVQTPQPLVFDLPRGSTGATVLQNSSPQATAANQQIVVTGPFAPGATLVQFAYAMPYSTGDLTIEQAMPVQLSRLIVMAQKSGDMRLASAQLTEQREMSAEGQTYLVGQGPAVRAGDAIALAFSNLPHEPAWPRRVALALAVGILVVGAWASRRKTSGPANARALDRLETKRSQLFAELTSIEDQHREGRLESERYSTRRAELVAALERVYAEIDRQAA